LGIQNSKQDMRQQDMLKAVPKNRPNPSKDWNIFEEDNPSFWKRKYT
jgi:hypothetical protein